MNKFNQAYKEFLKEVKTEAWSDYLKNVKDQLHKNTPFGLKALTSGVYDFDRAELNQEIVIPEISPLKNFIKSKPVTFIPGTAASTMKPGQHFMYLGAKADIKSKDYIEFVEVIKNINEEAARRFTELYPNLDRTKANNIKIKTTLGDEIIYVLDFGGQIYAGFQE